MSPRTEYEEVMAFYTGKVLYFIMQKNLRAPGEWNER